MGERFVSETCRGVVCGIDGCGKPAAAKVGEEISPDDPYPYRHNLTNYLCAECFERVMGKPGVDFVDHLRDMVTQGKIPRPPTPSHPLPDDVAQLRDYANEMWSLLDTLRKIAYETDPEDPTIPVIASLLQRHPGFGR